MKDIGNIENMPFTQNSFLYNLSCLQWLSNASFNFRDEREEEKEEEEDARDKREMAE